jgi:hypothetical protein
LHGCGRLTGYNHCVKKSFKDFSFLAFTINIVAFFTLNFIPHSGIPVMRWAHVLDHYQRHTTQKKAVPKDTASKHYNFGRKFKLSSF